MKLNLPIIALVLLGFTSCKKDQETQRPPLTIQYDVECKYCLVYVDDQYSSRKPFVVNGKWHYETEAGTLDSARIETYTPPYTAPSRVKSSISLNWTKMASKEEDQFGNTIKYAVGLEQYKK